MKAFDIDLSTRPIYCTTGALQGLSDWHLMTIERCYSLHAHIDTLFRNIFIYKHNFCSWKSFINKKVHYCANLFCHHILLIFSFLFAGVNPQLGKGTLVYLPITNSKDFTKDPSKWDARVRNVDGARITLQVRIPASAAVGVWRLRVSTKPQGSRDIKTFEVNNKIYLLFNAWNNGKLK